MVQSTTYEVLRRMSGAFIVVMLICTLILFLGIYGFGAQEAAIKSFNATSASWFQITFLALAGAFCFGIPKAQSRLALLLTLFPFLIGWRIASLAQIPAVQIIGLVTFLLLLSLVALTAIQDWRQERTAGENNTFGPTGVHLGAIRLYLGLDLVPHFTEKLFAGPASRADDVQAFQALGIPDAFSMVLLAGLIELAASIGIGLGLFTRLASVCTVFYLLVATVLGNHFNLGFIWASPGGGWEYPVLWSVLILSFLSGRGGWMSLDQLLRTHFQLPGWMTALMNEVKPPSNTGCEVVPT